jgi:O-antigen/teichoic acid export membrane protein
MSAVRISRGVAANIYDKLAIAGIQIALVPVLATHWGLETYGAWVLLATIPSFLAMSDFGFATAAGIQMTMLVANGRRDEAVRVFQSAWAVILPSTFVVLLLALLTCWVVPAAMLPVTPAFGSGEARLTLCLLIVYGLVSLQGSIFNAGFRCAGLFALGTFWAGNTIMIENGALLVAVLFDASPIEAAAALLGGRLVALVAQNLLLRRQVPWLRIGLGEARRDTARALLHPAVAIMMLPLAQASFLQGTAIALGAAAGPAAVPAFTAARTLSRIGLQITQVLTHALMPEFSAAFARGDRPAQARMIVATLLAAAVVCVPFALVLAVGGPRIVALWTHGVIHPSTGLMWAMAATVVLGGVWNPLSNLILAMNRHAGFSYPFVVLALLTMPVSYFLSAQMGAAGAGLSIALMDLAMCMVIFRLGRRLFVSRAEMMAALTEMGTESRAVVRRRFS